MSHYLKIVFLSLVAVAIAAVGVFWLLPIGHVRAHNESYSAPPLISATSSRAPTRKGSSPTPTTVAKKSPSPIPTGMVTKHPSPTPTVGKTKHSLARNAQAQGPYTVQG